MSYYTKNENKKYSHIHIYRYIYIIEFKQIEFSSEVSLMYKQEKKRDLKREEQGRR